MGPNEAHTYQNVPEEDVEGSNAELDEPIDLEEKDYGDIRRYSQRRGWREILSPYRWVLDVFLLFVIVGLLLARLWEPREKGPQYEVGGDVTGFAPLFSQQIVTFKPDPSYVPEDPEEFFTKEVREKWLSLMPVSMGFVKIDDPDQYKDLPTPLNMYLDKGAFVVETSVTHQLHCLYAVLQAHAWLSLNRTGSTQTQAPWHLAHCFDYLRQSIMCSSDVALEGQQTTFRDGQDGSDGWDAKHVCRDYSQVKEHLKKHVAENQTWI